MVGISVFSRVALACEFRKWLIGEPSADFRRVGAQDLFKDLWAGSLGKICAHNP